MNDIYRHFQKNNLKPTPVLINDYIDEFGGAIIKTFRDEIFTDDVNVTMDTEKTIVLQHPLCNGEFAARVEINPNFIVSITYFKPKSKLVLAN
jgi:hypothetical protein